MLKRSHWMAIGGVVFAGFVLAAVPLVQRAGANAPAALPATADEAPAQPAKTVAPVPALPAARVAQNTQVQKVQKAEKVAAACTDCGTVVAVNSVQVAGNTSGVGGVTGGVLGAVVGHQFGGGNGKTLASIAGAVGGAMAGNAVERNMKRQTRYDVVVQMGDGRRETFSYTSLPPFRTGEAVKVEAGSLRAASA